MSGATPVYVSLTPDADNQGFVFDSNQLRDAFSPRTRALLLNSPHNPTGKVFSRDELQLIAALCHQHDVIAITDEVYEHLTYSPSHPHLPLATLPGMADRTITLSSLGKTFSLTGWKIGWAIAPAHLTAAVRSAHQFLTFTTSTPLQHGAAEILANPGNEIEAVRTLYQENRDKLSAALGSLGFIVYPSYGTYFLMADHSRFGFPDDVAFCRHLTQHVRVAAIPPSSFYHRTQLGSRLVRFAFCKRRETIDAAIANLRQLKPIN
jgi:N-succinyldiaminopimelate aminotransferase